MMASAAARQSARRPRSQRWHVQSVSNGQTDRSGEPPAEPRFGCKVTREAHTPALLAVVRESTLAKAANSRPPRLVSARVQAADGLLCQLTLCRSDRALLTRPPPLSLPCPSPMHLHGAMHARRRRPLFQSYPASSNMLRATLPRGEGGRCRLVYNGCTTPITAVHGGRRTRLCACNVARLYLLRRRLPPLGVLAGGMIRWLRTAPSVARGRLHRPFIRPAVEIKAQPRTSKGETQQLAGASFSTVGPELDSTADGLCFRHSTPGTPRGPGGGGERRGLEGPPPKRADINVDLDMLFSSSDQGRFRFRRLRGRSPTRRDKHFFQGWNVFRLLRMA